MNKVAHFEVCQKPCSTLSREDITKIVKKIVEKWTEMPVNKNLLEEFAISQENEITKLTDHVDSIICSTNDEESRAIVMADYDTSKFFVYRLSQETAATETVQHDSEELSMASHTILPSVEYHGLWESLYYDTNIKENLLNFVETAMMFSDRKVDPNIISWNKVVLLHGPPGTGKTSLCKALAQKAAIRLGERYSFVELVEINSHSLFSKWFSESGKLVMKLFDEVKRLLENPESLVCVLIDEVESLAHARKSCANGTEPSDAIRVVNALLTQLDHIKSYPNVLILTTSNVTEAIDLAFVDRADIKQYIGHPEQKAIYEIYRSCLFELMRTKFLVEQHIPPFRSWPIPANVICRRSATASLDKDESADLPKFILPTLCERSIGLSGRTLRKIPFLAHAMYIKTGECSLRDFLEAMEKTIEKQIENDFLCK